MFAATRPMNTLRRTAPFNFSSALQRLTFSQICSTGLPFQSGEKEISQFFLPPFPRSGNGPHLDIGALSKNPRQQKRKQA
jgi:hypothetical protein